MKPTRNLSLNILSAVMLMLSASAAQANELPVNELPASFFGEAPHGSNQLNFDRLDAVLKASVLAEGEPSRNTVVPRNNVLEGSRVKAVENIYTALTANRFHFEAYRKAPQMRQMVSQIRHDLSQFPATTPLNSLPRAEQLAYWLNLYNVTVLDEVIKVYPRKNLQSLMLGDEGLLEQKILNVAGVDLSLNDIQFEILPRQFHALCSICVIFVVFVAGKCMLPWVKHKSIPWEGVSRQCIDAYAADSVVLFVALIGRSR